MHMSASTLLFSGIVSFDTSVGYLSEFYPLIGILLYQSLVVPQYERNGADTTGQVLVQKSSKITLKAAAGYWLWE